MSADLREIVARAIDPETWLLHDRSPRPPEHPRRQSLVVGSLATADAVLAALGVETREEWGVRYAGGRVASVGPWRGMAERWIRRTRACSSPAPEPGAIVHRTVTTIRHATEWSEA